MRNRYMERHQQRNARQRRLQALSYARLALLAVMTAVVVSMALTRPLSVVSSH